MSDCGNNPFDGGLLCEREELRAELAAMSQDILKVQCELAEAKNNYDTAQEAWYSEVERRKSLEKEVERLNLEKWAYVAENRDLNTERTEDRAAIRALKNAGQKLVDVEQVDDEGFVTAAFNDAYREWADALSQNAAAIRRAMGEGK